MALYEVTDTTALIAKRIAQAMGALILNTDSHDDTMRLQGFGLSLAFVFEETTGLSAKNKKPSDLIRWAFDLPEPLIKRVRLN